MNQDADRFKKQRETMNRTVLPAAVSAACFIQMLFAGDKAGNSDAFSVTAT